MVQYGFTTELWHDAKKIEKDLRYEMGREKK